MSKYSLCLFAVSGVAVGLVAQRPSQYPPAWEQFQISQFADPRRVCVARLGCGPLRPAEVVILEVMPDAKSLRPLFRQSLVTELVWWQICSVSGGRFLVTFNDRVTPDLLHEIAPGDAVNAIVIYDLILKTHKVFSEEHFLPQDTLRRKDRPEGIYGRSMWFDAREDCLYVSRAKFARDNDLPYLVIDLPGAMVLTKPTPSDEVEEASHRQMVDVQVSNPYCWVSSPGKDGEADWALPHQLPMYLKAEPVSVVGDSVLRRSDTMYFRWDRRSGTYMRCHAEEWVAPKEVQIVKPEASDSVEPVPGGK